MEKIKGVILAGGTGSRLFPLTKVTNKHLLPIFSKPMIYYPLQTLIDAGIKDIMIVTGGENTGDFIKLLGSGHDLGVRLTYRCQDGSGGIPVALSLAKEFVDNNKCVVMLGDNIVEDNGRIKEFIEDFKTSPKGAKIILKKVKDPERYGVVELENNKISSIEEKPAKPKSDLTVIGCYMFDKKAFDIIPALKPSKRGELEIVDVINHYLKNNDLEFDILDGFWIDAGTFEGLFEASSYFAKKK